MDFATELLAALENLDETVDEEEELRVMLDAIDKAPEIKSNPSIDAGCRNNGGRPTIKGDHPESVGA